MRVMFSVTESAEWLWAYVRHQGYEPVQYSPRYALLAVQDHSRSFPDAPATYWYQSASFEERQMFLTYWKQKCRTVAQMGENG